MREEEAIAVLREGDPAGLESLVERHQLEALRTALIITGDRPTAEDVVEEAFVKVFQRIRQFRRGAPFAPWFYRIVVNEALSATRRRALLAPLSPATDTRPDPAPGPEQLAELSELQAHLLAAVRELPPRERAAVVLRYYLDLDERAVAATLGWPLGTVKTRLHRARVRLRGLIPHDTRDAWAYRPAGGDS
jgi:RNA polymerase sigma-70 factor (ECF subfamily)